MHGLPEVVRHESDNLPAIVARPDRPIGPQTEFALSLHGEKHREPGESYKEAGSRLASTLLRHEEDKYYHAFRDIYYGLRFLPPGRVQSAIGSSKWVTAHNCFVAPTIDDTLADGGASIMEILKQGAKTMRMGGGIGFDFSTLRPSGDMIRKLNTYTSGPISFMAVFNAMGLCIASKGNRRGAMMATMRIDHPDIEAFIRAKQPTEEQQTLWEMVEDLVEEDPRRHKAFTALQGTLNLQGFNISILVTDEFMECLYSGKPFALRFNGQTYREIDARVLWDKVMRSTYEWAEPGVIFIDTVRRMNNLWYCEEISCTNPCSEQPLPPNGACLLGSFNWPAYIIGSEGNYSMDMGQLAEDIPVAVRAMDNVTDESKYPIHEQEKEAQSKRRMGLGSTGKANALEIMGHPYGSDSFLRKMDEIDRFITVHVYEAGVELAREKGAFPLFDAEKYGQSKFIQTLPNELQIAIRRHGVRCSHFRSDAPTGSISLTADNVSSGNEPVFAGEDYKVLRTVNRAEGVQEVEIEDYAHRVFGTKGRRVEDITPQEHLDVLIVASRHVDSAVSKTVNTPKSVSWEVFRNLYHDGWEKGVKALSTFRVGGKRMGILKASEKSKANGSEACVINPETGERDCS